MSHLGQTFRVGTQEFLKFKSKVWLKVFYDNCSGKSYLNNESEALSINTDNKYSILSSVDDSLKINNKFEFIIEWPPLSTYFQWKQDNNPIEENETAGVSKASGFVPIHNGTSTKCWGGLVRTTIEYDGGINSLLDGCPGASYWYFAIGMYNTVCPAWYNRGYPTYYESFDPASNIIYLWLRVAQPFVGLYSCGLSPRKNMILTNLI